MEAAVGRQSCSPTQPMAGGGPDAGRTLIDDFTEGMMSATGAASRKRRFCYRDEKPIPFDSGPSRLDSWELVSIASWGMEEVLAWAMAVARRHRVQPEDACLHKFVSLSGPSLLKMNRLQLAELSPKMGQELFEDLVRLEALEAASNAQASTSQTSGAPVGSHVLLPTSLAYTPSYFLDYLTNSRGETTQQPSFLDQFFPPESSSVGTQPRSSVITDTREGRRANGPTVGELLEAVGNPGLAMSRKANLLQRWVQERPPADDTIASQALAINRSIFSQLASTGRPPQDFLRAALEPPAPPGVRLIKVEAEEPTATTPELVEREEQAFRANFPPRNKRAHGKKHVLWQFILLCLGDPSACPSVVRWEDRGRGIFRIVSSLELARLWGQRKNRNKTMSYEKLSRAMRAYYKEGILFPGPRSGRFPKKLVYQFGPNADGWEAVATGQRRTCVGNEAAE